MLKGLFFGFAAKDRSNRSDVNSLPKQTTDGEIQQAILILQGRLEVLNGFEFPSPLQQQQKAVIKDMIKGHQKTLKKLTNI